MSPLKRYTLLGIGFIIFIIAVPVFTLGIRGFTYDFQTRQLVKTGMIVARTEPRNALLTAEGRNGTVEKDRTPTAMRFLNPDDYRVTIEKDGFHTWQKTLVVRGGLVAWANAYSDRIVLLPKEPKLLETSSKYKGEQESDRYSYSLEAAPESADRLQLVATETGNLQNKNVLIGNIPYRPNARLATYASGLGFIIADRVLYQIGNDELHYVADGVDFASWDTAINKLVYGNANELNIFNPYDPSSAQKELLTRTNEVGGSYCIAPGLGYALRSYGSTIRAIELDGRDRRNTYDIFTSDTPLEVITCDRQGERIVIKDGELYKTYSLRQ